MTHIDGIFRDHKPAPKPKPDRSGTVKCGCGCSTEISAFDDHGRQRRFVSGHAARVQCGDAWGEAQKDQFRALWMEGKPIREIAAIMDMPKNTVPGRAQRMKLPGRASPIKDRLSLTPAERLDRERQRDAARRAGAETRKPALRIVMRNTASNQSTPKPIRRVARPMVDLDQSRNLLVGELTRETCGFPTSTEKANTHSGSLHRFCGCAVKKGDLFCPGHMAIAFPKSLVEVQPEPQPMTTEKDLAA